MDVRVASSAIHSVVHVLARAALPTTSGDMLGAHLAHRGTECSSALSWSWVVRDGETTAVRTHIGVSTCTICSVDLGSACTCENAHFVMDG